MPEEIIHLHVAHDGGNGYNKDAIDDHVTKFPSVITPVLPGNPQIQLNPDNYADIKALLDDFLDHMDVEVLSKSLHESKRYFIGETANQSGQMVTTFNVDSNEGKYTSDISLICLFSLIAYSGIKKYFESYHRLPDQALKVEVDKLVTALPIDEIKLPNIREIFSKRFTDNDHIVILKNFKNDIKVNLHIRNASVWPEGLVSQYGLIWSPNNPRYFRDDSIFDGVVDVQGDGAVQIKNGRDVQRVGKTLGIDIGDGTTDFYVADGASALPNVNSSLTWGIGNCAARAAQTLYIRHPQFGKINRQKFMDQLQHSRRPAQRKAFSDLLDEQLVNLGDKIIEQIKTIYRQEDNELDLIVISGGGADLFKKHYEAQLEDSIRNIMPYGAPPILWVAPDYAQTLNLDGLRVILAAQKG